MKPTHAQPRWSTEEADGCMDQRMMRMREGSSYALWISIPVGSSSSRNPHPSRALTPSLFSMQKKGYIHSEGRVGGHKTAVMGFDRDKNYRLASVCPAK